MVSDIQGPLNPDKNGIFDHKSPMFRQTLKCDGLLIIQTRYEVTKGYIKDCHSVCVSENISI